VDAGVEAVVMGRVGADLYPAPDQITKPLKEIERYHRYVGGFAGNVATGLARLGVRAAIVSRVGADGHGEFVREFLAREGVDVRWLGTDPEYLTPLTFCEIWPPDRFPLTFYRDPTAPDWRVELADVDLEELAAAPLLFATGTALARSPSRETTLECMAAHRGLTVFDLDHREVLWRNPADYPRWALEGCRRADVVVGNSEELARATGCGEEPEAVERVRRCGPRLVVVKRGGRGAAVYGAEGVAEVPGIAVEVVNGLGAGDAFAAAFGYGLLRGMAPAEAARLGNAAGAMVAMQIPCSAAMPTREELEAFLARHR
jgi:5-dehydro-2-deoxygluconokinase